MQKSKINIEVWSETMISLLLLFISAVIAMVFINIIPMGLKKTEKIIISVGAPFIGSLGLLFSIFAAVWQSVLIMLLLAAALGYIIVTLTKIEGKESLFNGPLDQEINVKVSKNEPENPFALIQKDRAPTETSILPSVHVTLPNAIPFKQDVLNIEDDISFLDARNNQIQHEELELDELNVIPVINFEDLNDGGNEKEAYTFLHS
jgi:hypothetical protein